MQNPRNACRKPSAARRAAVGSNLACRQQQRGPPSAATLLAYTSTAGCRSQHRMEEEKKMKRLGRNMASSPQDEEAGIGRDRGSVLVYVQACGGTARWRTPVRHGVVCRCWQPHDAEGPQRQRHVAAGGAGDGGGGRWRRSPHGGWAGGEAPGWRAGGGATRGRTEGASRGVGGRARRQRSSSGAAVNAARITLRRMMRGFLEGG
jgi:hypothetical protein